MVEERGKNGSPAPVQAPSRRIPAPQEGFATYEEGRQGVSYNRLFGPYLAGARSITIRDPYIRFPYQIRNFAEFLETVYNFADEAPDAQEVGKAGNAPDASDARAVSPGDGTVRVHLITVATDDGHIDLQMDALDEIATIFLRYGIDMTYEFDPGVHDRSIVADTGWRIMLGRGLDIFQRYDDTNWFNPQVRHQRLRSVREFTVTYLRAESNLAQ